MCKFRKIQLGLIIIVGFATCRIAPAQMFGDRTFGRTLSRRVGPNQFNDAGTLSGSERFLRGNRKNGDFVGVDSSNGQPFVGRPDALAGSAIRRFTNNARRPRPSRRRRQLNLPLPVPKQGQRYHPELSIAFEFIESVHSARADVLMARMEESLRGSGDSRIEVSLEGRTAILRGEVVSDEQRELARIFAMFEPGISHVRNELAVVPDSFPEFELLPPAETSGER